MRMRVTLSTSDTFVSVGVLSGSAVTERMCERVDALVLAVEGEAGRDVAEDAVPLVRPEVVGDDLGDLEAAVVLDRDRRAVVRDALGRLSGGPPTA